MATTTTTPRERPFHHPPFGQEHEPRAAFGTAHHFQAPLARGLGGDPLVEAMIMILAQQFPETFKSKHSSGIPTCLFVNRHAKMGLSEHKCSSVGWRWPWASWFPKCANISVPMRCCVRCTTSFVTSRITEKAILKSR